MFFNKLYHNNDIATCFDRALERRILACVFLQSVFQRYIHYLCTVICTARGFREKHWQTAKGSNNNQGLENVSNSTWLVYQKKKKKKENLKYLWVLWDQKVVNRMFWYSRPKRDQKLKQGRFRLQINIDFSCQSSCLLGQFNPDSSPGTTNFKVVIECFSKRCILQFSEELKSQWPVLQ